MSVLPAYRNQSINLHNKSVDWFLYDGLTGFYMRATLTFNGLKHCISFQTEAEKRDDENQQAKRLFRYYFQHPNFRLLIIGTLVVLNFYMFAEDPVRHSVTESKIAVIGNIFSLLFTK